MDWPKDFSICEREAARQTAALCLAALPVRPRNHAESNRGAWTIPARIDENRPQAFQSQTQAHGRRLVFELGRLRQHIEESPRPTWTDQRGNQLGKAVAVERAEDGFNAFEAVHDGRR